MPSLKAAATTANLSSFAPADCTVAQQVNTLYVEHHSWVFSWLWKKLGCREQAADLSQDTFVRLLKKQQVLALNEPRAFLTTIAQRVLANYWRRELLESAYLDALASLPAQFVMSEEERYLVFEALAEIDRLLDGLPLDVKRAFLLSQLDGLKQAEIAEQLNISVTTVKRHLVRATAQCYFAVGVQ